MCGKFVGMMASVDVLERVLEGVFVLRARLLECDDGLEFMSAPLGTQQALMACGQDHFGAFLFRYRERTYLCFHCFGRVL